jgi:predicted MFS family arabinose efflux permease
MLARVVAGAFGGPATSLAYSIIADVIPAERRGRVMGVVMGAFAVASVLGVPAGLELARLGSWKTPFIAVALMGAAIGTYAHAALPPMIGHLAHARTRSAIADLGAMMRLDLVLSLMMSFIVMRHRARDHRHRRHEPARRRERDDPLRRPAGRPGWRDRVALPR